MKSEAQRILVTAALPYANGLIHLGHLAGAYLPADMYVRYQRCEEARCSVHLWFGRTWCALSRSRLRKKKYAAGSCRPISQPEQVRLRKFGMSFDNYSGRPCRSIIRLHRSSLPNSIAGAFCERKRSSSFIARRTRCFWLIGMWKEHARTASSQSPGRSM